MVSFWSKVTGIPRTQFTRTSFIRTKVKKVYDDKDNHFGTFRVKVKNGTNLLRRILGARGYR